MWRTRFNAVADGNTEPIRSTAISYRPGTKVSVCHLTKKRTARSARRPSRSIASVHKNSYSANARISPGSICLRNRAQQVLAYLLGASRQRRDVAVAPPPVSPLQISSCFGIFPVARIHKPPGASLPGSRPPVPTVFSGVHRAQARPPWWPMLVATLGLLPRPCQFNEWSRL